VSPLLDRQRRGVVLGSIRIGTTVKSEGKVRPVKLDTFRLTSPDRAKVDAASALYGGEVKPWQPQERRGGQQYEVVTTVDRLPVRVPPGEPVEQSYELWNGRPVVRQRLCDGFLDRMSGGPCRCPSDLMERRDSATFGNACKPVTRLSLILADLPGLGIWTLTSTGDYAADELASVAEMLRQSAAAGIMLPATLRLEQRESRGSGKVHHFAVPVLDVGASLAALESGDFTPAGVLTAHAEQRRAIESGAGAPASSTPPSSGPGHDQAAAPAPLPGWPTDPQGVARSAVETADAQRVRELGGYARDRGWLTDDTWVDPGDGILEPLESVLRHRLDALGVNA
jgi:hypothetical protein